MKEFCGIDRNLRLRNEDYRFFVSCVCGIILLLRYLINIKSCFEEDLFILNECLIVFICEWFFYGDVVDVVGILYWFVECWEVVCYI